MFSVFPTIETPRLFLRQVSAVDAQSVFDIFSDEEVTRYHDSSTYTEIGQAFGWIERRKLAYENGKAIRWAIARREDDLMIGSCGFGALNREAGRAEVGYELARSFWRQGLMTEALGAALRFGFEQMNLQRIVGEVMLDNAASCRLLIKLGFREENICKGRGYWKGERHDLRSFVVEAREYDGR